MKTHKMLKAAAAVIVPALILCGCFFARQKPEHPPPVITLQPADLFVRDGQNISFEARAKGKDLTYQWYYKKSDFSRWYRWKGHTTPKTFATVNTTWHGMSVYCCIKDKYGGSVTTRVARVSLGNHPPVILSQPHSVTVNLGETAYFRVTAEGNGKLKYQWYYQKSHSAFWTKWRGRTLHELQAVCNNSWDGMRVFCIVTDSAGGSVSSAPATVSVTDSPTIVTQPESAVLSDSSTDHSAEFRVTGGTEGLEYQWFYVPCGSVSGIKLTDRNQPVLSVTFQNPRTRGNVYCVLKCPGGSAVFSDRAEILPSGTPLITSDPEPVAAKSGDSMNFSVKATGDGLKYQWYIKRKYSANWTPLCGHTQSQISLPALKALSGSEIRCEITDRRGNRMTSLPAGITVNDKINITSQPKDVTVSPGEQVRLRIGIGTDCADVRFQWYANRNDGFGWQKLAGQTESQFVGTADSSWQGMKLRCVLVADGCPAVYSAIASVTVNNQLNLQSSPENISALSGKTVRFSVRATGRDLKYQWMKTDNDSGKWVVWEGQTHSSAVLSAKRSCHRMKVRCDISDCTGKTVSSQSASVWIRDALDILKQPRSISVRAYESATFSVVAQGKGLRYQWYYRKKDMKHWHIWKNHTQSDTSAVSNPSWDGMQVRCVITDAYGSRMTSKASVIKIQLSQ